MYYILMPNKETKESSDLIKPLTAVNLHEYFNKGGSPFGIYGFYSSLDKAKIDAYFLFKTQLEIAKDDLP